MLTTHISNVDCYVLLFFLLNYSHLEVFSCSSRNFYEVENRVAHFLVGKQETGK